jgi:hypothetical protein
MIDEQAIREQLERAVAPLDPAAPPLEMLRARATRRRRLQYAIGVSVTAVTAAIVAVVLVAIPGNDSDEVMVGKAPSADSLAAYASAHDGKHVAGPIASSSGYYGAFTVKKGIQVVHFVGDVWQLDGAPLTTFGPGRWVLRLSDGGSVVPGAPSFAMRYQGGDVSYFGGVVSNAGGAWRAERFDRCVVKDISCNYRGTTQPYGHVNNGKFVSMHNDCTPYCAAGHLYRVTWWWNSSSERFEVAAAQRQGRWADRP